MEQAAICPVGDHPFTYDSRHAGHRPTYCSEQHRSQAQTARRMAREEAKAQRWCPKGQHMVTVSDFSSSTAPYCRTHMAQYERDRRAASPDPLRSRRDSLARYGLTFEQFDAMLAAQGGRCKICGSTKPGQVNAGPRGWHVDHDHACCNTRKRSCGRCIRGIICSRCNRAIGLLDEDPVVIRAVLDYLLAYRARREGQLTAPGVLLNGGLQPGDLLPDAAVRAG